MTRVLAAAPMVLFLLVALFAPRWGATPTLAPIVPLEPPVPDPAATCVQDDPGDLTVVQGEQLRRLHAAPDPSLVTVGDIQQVCLGYQGSLQVFIQYRELRDWAEPDRGLPEVVVTVQDEDNAWEIRLRSAATSEGEAAPADLVEVPSGDPVCSGGWVLGFTPPIISVEGFGATCFGDAPALDVHVASDYYEPEFSDRLGDTFSGAVGQVNQPAPAFPTAEDAIRSALPDTETYLGDCAQAPPEAPGQCSLLALEVEGGWFYSLGPPQTDVITYLLLGRVANGDWTVLDADVTDDELPAELRAAPAPAPGPPGKRLGYGADSSAVPGTP